MKFEVEVNTSGDGYWSDIAKTVKVTEIDVPWINDDGDFGELTVYFNISNWDVHTDGLIYTDRKFEQELKVLLFSIGLSTGFSYSEPSMQGEDYVSFDVEKDFIDSWKKLTAEVA